MPNKSRFSLFMDHIFLPFIAAMHFSNLTADNCENPLLAKKFHVHFLQENDFRIKEKNIHKQQKKKSPYLFLAHGLIPRRIWIWSPQSHFDQSSGGILLNT